MADRFRQAQDTFTTSEPKRNFLTIQNFIFMSIFVYGILKLTGSIKQVECNGKICLQFDKPSGNVCDYSEDEPVPDRKKNEKD